MSGYIRILDTGYINPGLVTGVQAPTIINNSNPVIIKAENISLTGSANINTNPIVGSSSLPDAAFSSISGLSINIKGVVNRDNKYELDDLHHLFAMKGSYGVKLLYYDDLSDGFYTFINREGEVNEDDVHKDNNFGGVATPHLHVRVEELEVTQTTSSHIRYDMKLVTT